MVERRDGPQRTFYSLLPLNYQVLRGLAEYCGLHIWLDTEDAFGANENLVMVHAATAGEKRVKLPRPARILDARTGEVLLEQGDTLKVKLEKYENGVYILE